MVSRDKYKKVGDLYTQGTELEISEGVFLYMKVLNPFELEEARSHAQAARARMVLALKEHGSDERAKFEAKFDFDGRDKAIELIAESRANLQLPKIIEEMQDDPEWSEIAELLERSPELASPTEEESKLIATSQKRYFTEVQDRLEREEEYQTRILNEMSDSEIVDAYRELWIERRGGEAAMREFRITEHWYAARACDAKLTSDGMYDHSRCEGHRILAWETREEVRALPEELHDKMAETMQELNFTVREGKGPGSLVSSSVSSASPSEEGEASTPSTPTETPEKHPGSSSSPSPTP